MPGSNRSVSIRGDVYERLKAYCAKHKVELGAAVRMALDDFESKPVPLPVRAEKPKPPHLRKWRPINTDARNYAVSVDTKVAERIFDVAFNEKKTMRAVADEAINAMLDDLESGGAAERCAA